MKKFLSFLVLLAVVAVPFACAGDVITQDVNRLPQAARDFIKQHFAASQVSYIKIESEFMKSTTYEVVMTDRVKLEFDSKGEWKEVDCENVAVPASLIPAYAQEYAKRNYPDVPVVKVERKRGIVEIELLNELSLKFDRQGRLTEIDD